MQGRYRRDHPTHGLRVNGFTAAESITGKKENGSEAVQVTHGKQVTGKTTGRGTGGTKGTGNKEQKSGKAKKRKAVEMENHFNGFYT